MKVEVECNPYNVILTPMYGEDLAEFDIESCDFLFIL